MSEEFTLLEEAEESSFFVIISPDFEFEESSYEYDSEGNDVSIKVLATVLELEKPSSNGRLYQFSEGNSIAESLVGKPIYYGVDFLGRHDNPIHRATSENSPCGIVEKAYVEGQKIKAKIKITLPSLVKKIRSGMKFLFSVGGSALKETFEKLKDKIVRVLHSARCNHLQIVDSNVKVGFPSAKMERVLEFGETVLFIESEEEEVEPENESKVLKGLTSLVVDLEEKRELLDKKEELSDEDVRTLRKEKVKVSFELVQLGLEGEHEDLVNKQNLVKIRRLKAENDKLNREILEDEKEVEELEREVYGKIQSLPEGQKKERLKKEFDQIKNDEDDDEEEEDGEIELSESEDESYVLTE